jgi:parallel beta helix pectate lyase-like protein
MKFRMWMLGSIFNLVVVLFVATSTVYAAPIRVDCGKGGSISATLAGLVQSGNTRGVTIFVTGTCKENITIGAFDHLVLQGLPIATLQDASNGSAPVVTIYNSYDVTLTGFTINGGLGGVQCLQYSYLTLYLNTIQQSGGAGVRFARSNGIVQNNSILNHGAQGIAVVNGSKLLTVSNTITNNAAAGMLVSFGSDVVAEFDTIKSNALGIRAVNSSVLRAIDLTISDNGGEGVRLESGSSASFEQSDTGNVITGNGGNGVSVNDLSFTDFIDTNNVSGNLTQPDVACYPQFSATRGAGTVGGTTNCTEPSSPVQKR